MGLFSDHPHTSVTEAINKAIIQENTTLEVELGVILQLIRSGDADSNQIEAARAIRKRLKYGDLYQQSRALDLMNLFVSQLIHLPLFYNDFKLTNVLMLMSSGNSRYSKQISRKCNCYLIGWYQFLARHREVDGFDLLYSMSEKAYRSNNEKQRVINKTYKKRKKPMPKFFNDTADQRFVVADERYGIPRIDLATETPKIKLLISDSLETSVSLTNALQALPSNVNSTDDNECTAKFVQARALRRKVLRYLQLITGGELLGTLLHANEELVSALMAFDELAGENDMSSLNDSFASNEEASSAEDEREPAPAYDTIVDGSKSANPFKDPFSD